MEKLEYQDDTIPAHVAHFLRNKKREEAVRVLERQERARMDDDEMREIEKGQTFPGYNFMR